MSLATEWAGKFTGAILAPLTGALSLLRRARMFHPQGVTFRGQVEPVNAADQRHRAVAERLSGEALIRISTALWKHEHEWLDVLGLAIRFRSETDLTTEPSSSDQDLLFATVRSPWTTLLAPLTTHVHDYLDNDYYGVSPFFVPELGRLKWRLVSSRPHTLGNSRLERLRTAVKDGNASFELQERGLLGRRRWTAVARVSLLEEVALDQAALRFSPFRVGRGVEPRGFVHALRRATYASSQALRPHHA